MKFLKRIIQRTTGIGKIIRQKQKDIDASGKFADGRKGLMMLIKPTANLFTKM